MNLHRKNEVGLHVGRIGCIWEIIFSTLLQWWIDNDDNLKIDLDTDPGPASQIWSTQNSMGHELDLNLVSFCRPL